MRTTGARKAIIDVMLNSDDLWRSKKYRVEVKLEEAWHHPVSLCTYAIDQKCTSIILKDDSVKRFNESACVKVSILTHKGDPPADCASKSDKGIMSFENKVSVNCLKMLDDPTFSDFTFIVQGKRVFVHKAILAAASPVFYKMQDKMFTTNVYEKQNKCIVDDVEPSDFKKLLRFVYGGEIPEKLGDESMRLYSVAHLYEIEELIVVCKTMVQNELSAETAMYIYKLACLYDIEDVKMDAWTIIKR